MGEADPVMLDDFEMTKLLRANEVAQAIFFNFFSRTIACGFSSQNQYSQDVDANGKPMEFFGLLDFVALKAEESSHMTHHARGLICYRFFKLHNIIILWKKVLSSLGIGVMGICLVYLSENNFGPLNRMSKVWKEGIGSMNGILELPKRN